MRLRLLLCQAIAIILFLSSCAVTGENVFSTKNPHEQFVAAMTDDANEPVTAASEVPDVRSAPPRIYNPVKTVPAKTEAVPVPVPVVEKKAEEVKTVVQEPVKEEQVTAVTPAETEVKSEPEKTVEPEPVVTVPAVAENNNPVVLTEAVEEETPEQAPVETVPVEEIRIPQPETTVEEVAVKDPVLAEVMPQMGRPMVELLVITVAVIILYTVAAAVRNAFSTALPALPSAIAAVLITAVPITISSLVAGWSAVWLVYLVLLLTFFIFRGKKIKGTRWH